MNDDRRLQALRDQAAGNAPQALFALASALLAQGQVEEAHILHARAAQAGHAPAQIELARMLLHGIATPADPAQAAHWLQRAEAAGAVVAGYFLALIALGGVVLPRDGRINERLFAAVNVGFPPALRAAAIHFGRKPHVEDQALCMQLLQGAADGGDRLAASLLAARVAAGDAADKVVAPDLRQSAQTGGLDFTLPAVSASTPAQGDCPPRQLSLEDALYAAATTALSTAPKVGVIDRLLSADECRLLIASAQPALRESHTLDPQSGAAIALPIRTSSDASLDPILEDLALRTVQLRMAAAAGVELVQAEHLTVLRYAPGQQYRPHRDYLPPATIARDHPQAGNRLRTICVYLNDVESGGETEFPSADLRVEPTAGRAVVFDNLLADGSPDVASLHAGLPVLHGEKWLATLWIRQRQYRGF